MSATDPWDLPIFATPTPPPVSVRPGRVRSSFSYGESEQPRSHGGLHSVPTRSSRMETSRAVPSIAATDGVDWGLVRRLRVEVARRLADRMGEARWDRETQEAEGETLIRTVLAEEAAQAIATSGEAMTLAETEALARALFDACFGLGRLQPLVDDPRIENIMITGCDQVMVERADGTLWRMPPVADSDDDLVEELAFLAGRADNPRSFTPSHPSLHMTLPGGARLAAALDVARVSVVIRRHRVRQVTLAQLVEWGSITPTLAGFLAAAIRARLSIVVSGAQGAGKTTLLRGLCAEIDPNEVLGTFESEYELFLHEMPEQHRIVHAWESREGSGERSADGRAAGSRSTAEQIIDSFRFRLDRQILGEIRGPEVWSMVKLMESGSGSISTTHAADAQRAMDKLITCAMEAGPQISQELAAKKLAATVDLVVQLGCDVVRGPDGSEGRKHRYVEEVLHISRGEQARIYATSTVFAPVPGQCARAATLPDELMPALLRAGYDPVVFQREAMGGGQR